MRFLLCVILLTSLLSCGVHSQYTEDYETPPNGILVGDNFYCDGNEVTNFNWLEYMYWTGRIFGENSPEHLATFPDSTVWDDFEVCLTNGYEFHYLRHPAYRDYPAVGITQEQAKAYSQWRSDRVFEYILIREEVLEFDTAQTRDSYFTIDKYFKGEYLNKVPNPNIEAYPNFRLPTLEERKWILEYTDSASTAYYANCKSKTCKECAPLVPYILADQHPCNDDTNGDMCMPVRAGCAPGIQIYNLRGNVAEWIDESGLAAGGGWIDEKVEILENDIKRNTSHNAWTGFRNVCEWIKVKQRPASP